MNREKAKSMVHSTTYSTQTKADTKIIILTTSEFMGRFFPVQKVLQSIKRGEKGDRAEFLDVLNRWVDLERAKRKIRASFRHQPIEDVEYNIPSWSDGGRWWCAHYSPELMTEAGRWRTCPEPHCAHVSAGIISSGPRSTQVQMIPANDRLCQIS
jgi:hypothetical protein